MRDILSQITCKEMSTSKRMGYVNNFTTVLCILFKRELFGNWGSCLFAKFELFDKANNLVAEQLGKWKGNKFGYATKCITSITLGNCLCNLFVILLQHKLQEKIAHCNTPCYRHSLQFFVAAIVTRKRNQFFCVQCLSQCCNKIFSCCIV